MYDISPGKILIADPFLRDPNFIRSVVFLCEHKENGSVGFVLNKIYDQPLKELIEQVENTTFSVYYGGPVQRDTLHFLRRIIFARSSSLHPAPSLHLPRAPRSR